VIRLRGGAVTAKTYDGSSLVPGAVIEGPALVDDVDTTLLVPQGDRLEIDPMSNYVFTVGATIPTALAAAANGGAK
jgi:N-methylhydantoinase A/oxoprolinase/acetone carboxylase beta subunit